MRLNLNLNANCGPQTQAGFTHRPVALDLTAAKEGMEVTGEFQSSFFLGDKSGTGSRQSMEATEPVRHSRSGQQRNRQRLNDRVRMGCETRQLKN